MIEQDVSFRQKPTRFHVLDTLRGLGALAVMAGHSGEALHGYTPPHFYLAVDMFFVLSGFVLAHVYDRRFAAGMTPAAFMKARARRLYPIYLIGLLIGLGTVFISNIHGLSPLQVMASFAFSLFGLPSPPMGHYKALFPLNGPFWSLFLEFWCANLIYSVFWRQLHGKTLLAMIGGSALLLITMSLIHKEIDFGWNWHSFPGGVARVCFSFFAGVWLSRRHESRSLSVPGNFWLCLVACVALLFFPIPDIISAHYDVIAIIALCPMLIYFSASVADTPSRIGQALGKVSYALYAVHRPLIIPAVWLAEKSLLPPFLKAMSVGLEAIFIAIVTAGIWSASELYDLVKKNYRFRPMKVQI